jgi:hypothetical protein
MLSVGCGDSDGDDDSSTSSSATMTDDDSGTDTDAGDGDGDTTTGDGDGDTSTGDGDGDGDGGDGDGDEFVFDETPAEDYTQVDRMGMPAINTAVITSKDAYNADSPESDAAGVYVTEITDNLTGLHAALDGDLTTLTLVPCMVTDCVAQAAPLVVPDTLKLDPATAAGFPNGRALTDPVMDITLAVVLLDLAVEGQDATSLVGVNPTANDVAFSDSFPYVAAAN